VLRDCRPGHVKVFRDLTRCELPIPYQLKDLASTGFGESLDLRVHGQIC